MRTFAELVDGKSRVINDFLNADNLSNRRFNSLGTCVSFIHSFADHGRNQVRSFGKSINGAQSNFDSFHGVVDEALLFDNCACGAGDGLSNLLGRLRALMSRGGELFGGGGELACRVAGLLNNLAYGLAHFANGKSHCSEFVCAIGVKQIGAAEVAVFEKVQSLDHVAERIGDGFGNREAEEQQDNESAAESNEQIASSRLNALIAALNRVVRILVSFFLNSQNGFARCNRIRHNVTLIVFESGGSVVGDSLKVATDGRAHCHHFIAGVFEFGIFAFGSVNLSTSLRVVFDYLFVKSQRLVQFFNRAIVFIDTGLEQGGVCCQRCQNDLNLSITHGMTAPTDFKDAFQVRLADCVQIGLRLHDGEVADESDDDHTDDCDKVENQQLVRNPHIVHPRHKNISPFSWRVKKFFSLETLRREPCPANRPSQLSG